MTGLEGVRAHHVAAARERAAEILRDASAHAREITAKSAADAAAMIAQAEKDGEDASDLDTGREWTSARRRARNIMLAVQNELYTELRTAMAKSVRADPRYPALLQVLANAALRQLGPGAKATVDSAGNRGVTAQRKDRHVEWSLEKIIDESLERLGPKIQELWR